MARVLNLLIVIMEAIAFHKARKREIWGISLIYYTHLSNMLAGVSALLLVILGQKDFVEVLRYISVSMLAFTFLITVFVLAPQQGGPGSDLFKGSGFYHHLVVPILSAVSYFFAEDRAPIGWFWLPVLITLAYGIIMLFLNAKDRVDGPYPFFRIKEMGKRATALWMVLLVILMSILSAAVGYRQPSKTDLKYIFVHGLAGWGSYDTMNEFFPYWGLSGGSIIRYLNNRGYESYAASVDPTGSAWDRACELYAQLAGTRVDYGVAHSKAAGHERFGEDYTGRALMENFGHSGFVLIGHSFGGATVRLFSEILRNGDANERAVTEEGDISPFFRGGNGDNLFAVVTLAAPTNGTTAYDLYEDESFDLSTIEIPEEYEKNSDFVSKGTKATLDGRASYDYASFDMHIDNALALNQRITTFDDVYYLAYPCSSTMEDPKGGVIPDPSITENIFMKGAVYMSKYTGTTKGGFVIDGSWQPNDGLVNVISAGAPMGVPQTDYRDGADLSPGQWTVMPVFQGDHMSLQGGLTKRINVKPFYMELVKLLASI